MAEADKTNKSQSSIKGFLGFSVFVTAATAAIGHSIIKTWDMFYANMKGCGPISALRAQRDQAQANLLERTASSPLGSADFTKETRDIESRFSRQFNAFLKKSAGIESEGLGVVKGTVQRFRTLGPYSQAKIVCGAAFSVAATIGGYLLFRQDAKRDREFNALQQELTEAQKKIGDRLIQSDRSASTGM